MKVKPLSKDDCQFALNVCAVMALGIFLAGAKGHNAAARQQLSEYQDHYWRQMDQNHDGVLEETEYLEWMMFGFHQRDRNGDHALSGDELPQGQVKSITEAQQRQRLLRQFHAQDVDGNGVLDPHEFFTQPMARMSRARDSFVNVRQGTLAYSVTGVVACLSF